MNLLMTIPSPSISYFALGPLKIHFYALCILAGIVAAVWIADKRLTAQGAKSGVALDIALWTVPIGIIGARIFHVLTHPADYFYPGADLSVVFRVWEGGIAIYGGLIGGALGALIGSRRAGISFSTFADAVAPGLLLAQALGRWGNYFNQELFGEPTTLPWGLEIDSGNPAIPAGTAPGTLFHPTFLYESIWSLLGVAALLALDKRFRLNNGRLFALYLVIYSTGRLFTESLRLDPSEIILGLRTNIWSALFGIVIGLALFLVQTKRRSGVLDSTSNVLGKR
jgi:prolipoprotein diacylglyceryl transferase